MYHQSYPRLSGRAQAHIVPRVGPAAHFTADRSKIIQHASRVFDQIIVFELLG
jgi:hypothetical protein